MPPDPDRSAAPDAETVRGIAAAITSGFHRGGLDLSARRDAPSPGWDAMPEFRAIAAIRDAGASDLDVRLALTFGAAMDRARDSDRLWDAVAAFFADCRWAFRPEEASRRPLAELCAALKAAGVSQRHGKDCEAWRGIAASLLDPPRPKPCAAPCSRPMGTPQLSSPRSRLSETGRAAGSSICAGRRSR